MISIIAQSRPSAYANTIGVISNSPLRLKPQSDTQNPLKRVRRRGVVRFNALGVSGDDFNHRSSGPPRASPLRQHDRRNILRLRLKPQSDTQNPLKRVPQRGAVRFNALGVSGDDFNHRSKPAARLRQHNRRNIQQPAELLQLRHIRPGHTGDMIRAVFGDDAVEVRCHLDERGGQLVRPARATNAAYSSSVGATASPGIMAITYLPARRNRRASVMGPGAALK